MSSVTSGTVATTQMRAAACGMLRNASGIYQRTSLCTRSLGGVRSANLGSRGAASAAAGRLQATGVDAPTFRPPTPGSAGDGSSDVWADAYIGSPAGTTTQDFYSSVYGPITTSTDVPLMKPAELDALKFTLDPSVNFWRDYSPEIVDDKAPLPEQLQWLNKVVQDGWQKNGVLGSSQSAAFWAYHTARTGFFMVQGLTGLLAARAATRATGNTESSTGLRLETLFRSGTARPIIEAFTAYQQDLQNIEAGYYKLPYDMTAALRHRQSNPLYVLSKGIQFAREAADTLARRDQQAATDVWLDSSLYPDYYKNTFHYQTDGWFSEKSASIYESSTETLFLGRQDAMQRSTLVPLARHLNATRAPTDGTGLKLLEVACGTGRFATYIKDNYQSMEVTCMDLSPFYLAKARENMKYWKGLRAPESNGPPALFMQAAAEAIAAPDNSYDAVTCVYLFHELPEAVRKTAAIEMARVLKPGGVLCLTDSVQYGDRLTFDKTLGNFSNFNEPYYLTYIREDLGKLFVDAGLEPDYKLVSSSTKTLSFKKPLTAAPAS